jgi:hypothetical protein
MVALLNLDGGCPFRHLFRSPGGRTIKGMEPTEISKLPDGRFTLSTDPIRALSEAELREELMATNSDPGVVEDIIYRAKQMR